MWIRHLIEHISKTYHLINKSLNLIPKTEIKIAYEKLLSFADNTQKSLYHQWWTIANDLQPKKLLQQSFLKENNSKKYFINVYFDPQIIVALNESLWWLRLNYEIPYSLTDVYKTRKNFRQMREETNGFIRKFNK
jgi:lipopolysaccharide export LptBFGC system permease protein LptF